VGVVIVVVVVVVVVGVAGCSLLFEIGFLGLLSLYGSLVFSLWVIMSSSSRKLVLGGVDWRGWKKGLIEWGKELVLIRMCPVLVGGWRE
jgi:hypothetical protein